MLDRLEIAKLVRLGGSQQRTRHSIDFLVNGESLFRITEAKYSDMCGRFSVDTPEETAKAKEEFLFHSPSELASGRSPLFVCPECGDIGCGAITVKVTKEDDYISWSEFAYENDYEEPRSIEIGPFRFEIDAYEKTIFAAAA